MLLSHKQLNNPKHSKHIVAICSFFFNKTTNETMYLIRHDSANKKLRPNQFFSFILFLFSFLHRHDSNVITCSRLK